MNADFLATAAIVMSAGCIPAGYLRRPSSLDKMDKGNNSVMAGGNRPWFQSLGTGAPSSACVLLHDSG